MPAEPRAIPLPPDVPRQLWPNDLDAVRLDDHPRVNSDLAHQVLQRSPGSSFWIPATSEFILVTPWRHRKELSTIHTLGAFAGEDLLMRATMEHARTSGKAGFVVVDINEVRHPAFYARFGLEPFEKIVTYEWRESRMLRSVRVDDRLEFIRLETRNTRLMRQVIALDHAAFPWFWWNSDWEFAVYLDQPGVEIWVGIRDDVVVSYAGVTLYRRWGHLDRIATDPERRGLGLGRTTLAFVLRRLASQGGKRVALSTQAANLRSRALYEGMGFAHTPRDDYAIYVAPFDTTRLFAGMPAAPAAMGTDHP